MSAKCLRSGRPRRAADAVVHVCAATRCTAPFRYKRVSCATPALPAHACCTRTRLRRTQTKRCWCLHREPGAKVPLSVTQLLPARGAAAVRQRGAPPSVRSRRTRAGRAGPARAKLRPHTVSPRLAVPEHIMRPPYVDTGENPFYDEVQVHDAQVRSQLCRRTRSSHHCCFSACQVRVMYSG